MIGEEAVDRFMNLARMFKYSAALWEWAVLEHGGQARLHFLKITLTDSIRSEGSRMLYSASGLSLFQARMPLRSVDEFVAYCLSTRQIHDETKAIPVPEKGYQLGAHTVPLFGNFGGHDAPELVNSVRARSGWPLKSDRPYFLLEYALHDSARPPKPGIPLYGGNPPFADPQGAYRYFFSVDRPQNDPWVAIVAPVNAAWVKSFQQTKTKLVVTLAILGEPARGLRLSAICRGKNEEDYSKQHPVNGDTVEFDVRFRPSSLELSVHLDEIQVDFVEWRDVRRAPLSGLDKIVRTRNIHDGQEAVSLFPRTFLKRQHPDVRRCLQHADDCVRHGLWVPAAVMIRKALDMAVNLRLMQLGKGNDVYSGEFEKPLPSRLELLSQSLPSIRKHIREVLTVKWFGDQAAHSRMDVFEADIRSTIEPRLRSFLVHLGLGARRGSRANAENTVRVPTVGTRDV